MKLAERKVTVEPLVSHEISNSVFDETGLLYYLDHYPEATYLAALASVALA